MDKLRFLHIPKTAGSTFARVLLGRYKGKPRFVFKGNNPIDIERFSKLSKDEQNAVVLFTGHAPIVSGIKQADEVPMITILRDPVSRVKSFCQYVSEGKSGYLLNSFPPETFSLDDFLYSNNSELSNLQSRMLINYEKNASGLLINSLSPDETVTKALDNLFNSVTCYGLQEYFDESLVVISRRFGWKMPYYEYRNRKNLKRLLKFERHHIDRIRELNEIDIAFYEAAKNKFLARIESDAQLARTFHDFKRMQKIVSPIMKLYGDAGRYVKRHYRQGLKNANEK